MKDSAKHKIYAVHEREIEQFLEKIGILEDVMNEKIKCSVCRRAVTLENFGAVYYIKNKPAVVCDSIECISSIDVVV